MPRRRFDLEKISKKILVGFHFFLLKLLVCVTIVKWFLPHIVSQTLLRTYLPGPYYGIKLGFSKGNHSRLLCLCPCPPRPGHWDSRKAAVLCPRTPSTGRNTGRHLSPCSWFCRGRAVQWSGKWPLKRIVYNDRWMVKTYCVSLFRMTMRPGADSRRRTRGRSGRFRYRRGR